MPFDFGLIVGNPVYIATLGLSMCGWIIFMAGHAAAKSPGIVWFYVVYVLFLNMAVAVAIGTNSIRQYRLALLAFMTAAFIFLVDSVNSTIATIPTVFTGIKISVEYPPYQAASAGGMFILMVLCVWMIIFGSEDDSLVVTTISSFGIGKSPYPNNTGLQQQQQQQQQHLQQQQLPHQQQNIPRGPGAVSPQQENLSTVVVSPNADYAYRAQALYEYQANPDDQNELSFAKGEILDIADNKGKWWQARKADGSIGIAPSNYLQLI